MEAFSQQHNSFWIPSNQRNIDPMKQYYSQQQNGFGSSNEGTVISKNDITPIETKTPPNSKRKKKKRKGKLPTDKPKRPACSYNLFFHLERERLLLRNNSDGRYERNDTIEDVARAAAWHMETKPKRKHVKTHGKISFKDLSRTISAAWNSLPPSEREIYERQAAIENTAYKKRLAVWKASKNNIPGTDESFNLSDGENCNPTIAGGLNEWHSNDQHKMKQDHGESIRSISADGVVRFCQTAPPLQTPFQGGDASHLISQPPQQRDVPSLGITPVPDNQTEHGSQWESNSRQLNHSSFTSSTCGIPELTALSTEYDFGVGATFHEVRLEDVIKYGDSYHDRIWG